MNFGQQNPSEREMEGGAKRDIERGMGRDGRTAVGGPAVGIERFRNKEKNKSKFRYQEILK